MLHFFQGTPVVLLYHRKRWENQAGMGLRTQTGLTSTFSVTPRFSLSPSLVVLVPLEDRSKHLGQFVERVFIHAIHPPKESPPIDVRSVLLPVQTPRLGKQAMNYDRCDHTVLSTSTMTAASFILWSIPSRSDEGLEHCLGRKEGTEPEGAPRFLRSAMAQPISRLPLLLSATCGTAYDALMSPLCAGTTQIWKGLQKLGS